MAANKSTTFPTSSKSVASNSTITTSHITSTSTTISPTNNSTGLHTTPDKGLSGGAVAGIAIATAVAGAILTLIGLCIFLKGKRSSKYPSTLRGDRKEVTTRTVPNHRPAQLRLNELPLSRVDDSKIRTCMQDLNVLIHQHVENHYHNRELHADTPDLVQKLVQCGYPDSAEALAGFLINPRTRRTAIRRLLSAVIYSHIDIENNTGMSLLPGFVSDFTRAIFRAEKDAKDQDFYKYFLDWRRLSAFLLSPVPSFPENIESDANLHPVAVRCADLLNRILQPFVEPDIDSQRSQEENLISILMVASRLGLLLFSQPARWVFSWEDEEPGSNQENQFGSKRRTLMVSPGLKERITAGGRRHRPRVLVDAIEEHI